MSIPEKVEKEATVVTHEEFLINIDRHQNREEIRVQNLKASSSIAIYTVDKLKAAEESLTKIVNNGDYQGYVPVHVYILLYNIRSLKYLPTDEEIAAESAKITEFKNKNFPKFRNVDLNKFEERSVAGAQPILQFPLDDFIIQYGYKGYTFQSEDRGKARKKGNAMGSIIPSSSFSQTIAWAKRWTMDRKIDPWYLENMKWHVKNKFKEDDVEKMAADLHVCGEVLASRIGFTSEQSKEYIEFKKEDFTVIGFLTTVLAENYHFWYQEYKQSDREFILGEFRKAILNSELKDKDAKKVFKIFKKVDPNFPKPSEIKADNILNEQRFSLGKILQKKANEITTSDLKRLLKKIPEQALQVVRRKVQILLMSDESKVRADFILRGGESIHELINLDMTMNSHKEYNKELAELRMKTLQQISDKELRELVKLSTNRVNYPKLTSRYYVYLNNRLKIALSEKEYQNLISF